MIGTVGETPLRARRQISALRDQVDDLRATMPPVPPIATAPPRRLPVAAADDGALGKCERTILTVLDQQPAGCDRGKLTLLSGYRYTGGFRNSLSTLRTQGLIVGGNEEIMRITTAGHKRIAGTYEPLPQDPRALQRHWLGDPRLGKCEREVLGALFKSPRGLTAEELCRMTGYGWTGGFRNSLSALRTAGLITGKNTEVMKADAMFFTARAA